MTETNCSNETRHQVLSPEDSPEKVETAILQAIRSIRYGSVEVIIHDSRVVQIEYKKKIRVQVG